MDLLSALKENAGLKPSYTETEAFTDAVKQSQIGQMARDQCHNQAVSRYVLGDLISFLLFRENEYWRTVLK